MNKFPFFIVLSITLIGCVPSTLTSTQQSQLERPFTGTAPSESTPVETATQPPLREFFTPDPAGQVLDYTGWALKYAIINGEQIELNAYERLELYFRPDSVGIYDGCNRQSYGYVAGRPGYVADENGEFVFPLKEPGKEDTLGIVVGSTMLYCFHVDEESGEEISAGVPDFLPPYEEIVAYELDARHLRLYYPEDRRNVLVFERLRVDLRPTKSPTPDLTATTEATMTMMATSVPSLPTAVPTLLAPYPGPPTNEATTPTPYPGPTPIPPTPLPSYP